MKKTAFILFAAALACAVAAMTTGCRTRTGGLSPATQNAGLSMTNRVGVSIGNGQQVSGMMDKGSVLDSYASVANAAIKGKQQVAIIALSHGADKQPNVKDDKQTEKTLQDVLAQGIAAAKSGGSNEAMAKAGIEIVKGLAKLGAPTPEPAADNTSATVFALFAGDGANSAGVGAMAEGRMTRVEAIRAARAQVETISRDSYKETVSADGLTTMTALAKMQAEIDAAKIKANNSPAAVVGGPQSTGAKPEDAAPDAVPPPATGTGEPSSPAARVAAMYPGMRLGGGNFEEKKMPDGTVANGKAKPASERSLWKPASDNSGDLVVVLPHSAMGKILSMTVGGETVAPDSIGNGWRPHLRFSKPGSAYSGPFTIRTSDGDWTGTAPGGKRTEPIPMKKTSGTLSVSDLIVTPASKPEVVATPGESLAP